MFKRYRDQLYDWFNDRLNLLQAELIRHIDMNIGTNKQLNKMVLNQNTEHARNIFTLINNMDADIKKPLNEICESLLNLHDSVEKLTEQNRSGIDGFHFQIKRINENLKYIHGALDTIAKRPNYIEKQSEDPSIGRNIKDNED